MSVFPTIAGCEKCGGRKYQIAQAGGPPSDPVCGSCKGEGKYEDFFTKNYDHPYWSEEDRAFFNTFFGYDINQESERLKTEPSEKETQCCQENNERHFQKHQCCPSCHSLFDEWKKGGDVRRRLRRHLESGKCREGRAIRK